ncbi:hypothetical protein CALCODRAFT_501652 [Calocera cornea HHB12733]|uniref:Uncharacterized protein n=1 Tax=Calocera cornea HHB12733 TaxID=1353952 RepID=A0A165DK04_9BASI|nr:hypothetical protein CALCODRAFT_501652 [Calocera cornea HHB12733]
MAPFSASMVLRYGRGAPPAVALFGATFAGGTLDLRQTKQSNTPTEPRKRAPERAAMMMINAAGYQCEVTQSGRNATHCSQALRPHSFATTMLNHPPNGIGAALLREATFMGFGTCR